jgi:23S rRNA pseudouridine2605 synthase
MNTPDTTRVNKFLAHATGLSRREVDNAIHSGRVQINGKKVELGARVSASDVVLLDNQLVSAQTSYTYIALHKPTGYVSSRRAQGDTPTIYELLPEEYQRLKLVGRLDRDSSGIILLTDDGDFAQTMTHPSRHKQKTYEVTLDKDLEPLHQQMINDHGIVLDDGNSQLTLERMNETGRTEWRVMMHEGRNRQIRRTFAGLGYAVTRLHRTHFGPYLLNDLATGKYEVVSIV